MVVYADVVFLVNFIFNAVLLFALYKFRARKIRPFRLLAAAFFGGGLGVAVLIPYLQPFLSAASKYIVPFAMSAICFAPCGVKSVIMGGIYILSLSFLFAGMMEFFGVSAISGVFVVIPIALTFGRLKKILHKTHRETVLIYKDKKVVTEGFLDSGNFLDYKGTPVILASNGVFEELFGKGFNFPAVSEWIDIEDLRYIPYASLGKNGVIPGVVIDGAVVDGRVFDKVILGLLGNGFSEQVILASVMV